MKSISNKKKLIAVIISVSVVLVALITTLVVRSVIKKRPPELDEVRGRIEELLEAAREINEIFWGEGLPTYPRVYKNLEPFLLYRDGATFTTECPAGQDEDDAKTFYYFHFTDSTHGTILAYQYAWQEKEAGSDNYTYTDVQSGAVLTGEREEFRYAQQSTEVREDHGSTCIWCGEGGVHYYLLQDFTAPTYYYSDKDEPYYDYVREDSGYLAIDDIKRKAELVYSSGYLSSIYSTLFDGMKISNGTHGTLYARYLDKDGFLLMSNVTDEESGRNAYDQDLGYRVFDYSTMKMERKSNNKNIIISMESYQKDNPGKREGVELSFALENGQWFLDSPSC